jgi:hypothetical protein
MQRNASAAKNLLRRAADRTRIFRRWRRIGSPSYRPASSPPCPTFAARNRSPSEPSAYMRSKRAFGARRRSRALRRCLGRRRLSRSRWREAQPTTNSVPAPAARSPTSPRSFGEGPLLMAAAMHVLLRLRVRPAERTFASVLISHPLTVSDPAFQSRRLAQPRTTRWRLHGSDAGQHPLALPSRNLFLFRPSAKNRRSGGRKIIPFQLVRGARHASETLPPLPLLTAGD